jgi:hypothetical protein
MFGALVHSWRDKVIIRHAIAVFQARRRSQVTGERLNQDVSLVLGCPDHPDHSDSAAFSCVGDLMAAFGSQVTLASSACIFGYLRLS